MVAAMVYMALHFNENPVVIGVLEVLCLTFFLIVGEDHVILFKDRLTIKTNSILSWFQSTALRTYYINEIQSADLPQPEELPDAIDYILIKLLFTFIPAGNRYRTNNTIFFIKLKNGETVEIHSDISKRQAIRMVNEINYLLSQKRI